MSDSDTRLANELSALLNRCSRENASNTPDFILAQYMLGCLVAFENALNARERWYRNDPRDVPTPGPIVYAIARVEEAQYQFWNGPTPNLNEMLSTMGESENDVIVSMLKNDSQATVLYRWNNDTYEWVKEEVIQ